MFRGSQVIGRRYVYRKVIGGKRERERRKRRQRRKEKGGHNKIAKHSKRGARMTKKLQNEEGKILEENVGKKDGIKKRRKEDKIFF